MDIPKEMAEQAHQRMTLRREMIAAGVDFSVAADDEVAEWQPIETAPRDGTHVLLYVDECTVKVTGGYWDDHPKCRCWIAGGYMRKQFPPTHWMPLPEPPNVELTGAGTASG